MTTLVAPTEHDPAATPPHGTADARRWWIAGGLLLVAAVVVLGAARWNGEPPFGSDNDEYQLVARQLLELDAPVVAGVEGTKYPLGYPAALAAFDGIGLPLVDAALVLNVVLAGAAAAFAGVAARHRGAVAAVVAAGVVLASRPLWAATQGTMPDVALTAVVAGAVVVAGEAKRRVLGALTVLALVATALKSVGVLVGLAASVALLARRRSWRAAAVPAAVSLVLSAVTAVVVGRYAEHTTGYARTFWLDDPFDASAGDASVLDVAGRLGTRLDIVLDDAAKALWGDLVHGPPAWALTLGLVAAGVAGARARARWFLAAFVVLDLAALAVWPYASVRFGLPLVPIAALGAATIVAAVVDRVRVPPRLAAAVAVVGVAVLVAAAVPALDAEARREGAFFEELHRSREAVAAWLDANAPATTSTLVSPDYRELALALDRPVLALAYTLDGDELLRQARAGTHLVVLRGLYGSREVVVGTLLAAHGEQFELVHQTERFDVYRTAA